MLNFEQLVLGAHRVKASDIHLTPGNPPVVRVTGDLRPVKGDVVTHQDMSDLIDKLMPPRLRPRLELDRGADFSYVMPEVARFRCVAFYVNNELGMVMRLIPLTIPTAEDLKLPEVVKTVAELHRGMALLTGVTGSGKTTTLAAMLNHINTNLAHRIVTLEDPIEFTYPNKKSVITQREVGIDIPDFMQGLRQAMRMDPDIILIGEMRDVETIRISIKAAETGHLVFSTLHTTSAVHTIQRIIGHFDESEHALLREQLSLNLKASITQRLVKTVDMKGRRAAMEVMRVTPIVSKLIREDRIPDIFSVIRSRTDGMQVMDQGLSDLIIEGAISIDEALNYCDDEFAMRRYMKGLSSSGDAGAILSA